MDFVAIDVETANPDLSSICQIGAAKFSSDGLTDEWSTFVNPEDFFHPINVGIHGIDEQAVESEPSFLDVFPDLASFVGDRLCVSHMAFDRAAVSRACEKYRIEVPGWSWIDSAGMARRAWAEFSKRGYGLANLCRHIGYEFRHHDALEDAKAAGYVMLAASEASGIEADGWIEFVRTPLPRLVGEEWVSASAVSRKGNPDGPLVGEVVVFTGSLKLPRPEATLLATSVGCDVGASVTRKTTMLVLGDQDISKLAGHKRSTKQRKAEQLAAQGQPLRFLKESDFMRLVNENSPS